MKKILLIIIASVFLFGCPSKKAGPSKMAAFELVKPLVIEELQLNQDLLNWPGKREVFDHIQKRSDKVFTIDSWVDVILVGSTRHHYSAVVEINDSVAVPLQLVIDGKLVSD